MYRTQLSKQPKTHREHQQTKDKHQGTETQSSTQASPKATANPHNLHLPGKPSDTRSTALIAASRPVHARVCSPKRHGHAVLLELIQDLRGEVQTSSNSRLPR